MQNNSQSSDVILRAAFDAWQAAATLRTARQRNKRFTYGEQWSDVTKDKNGCLITDYERYCNNDANPITNNLLRQLVKTVVGRFRAQYLHDNTGNGDRNNDYSDVLDDNVLPLHELDARALEEFLISGCCVQRVDKVQYIAGSAAAVENVNINSFFVNRFSDPIGRDIELIGQIHDLPIATLIRRVAGGDRKKAQWVRRLYSNNPDYRTNQFRTAIGTDFTAGNEFWFADSTKCRAIEVWTLESHEMIIVHDKVKATVSIEPWSAMRRLQHNPNLDLRWDIINRWHCRWFSPMGDLLFETAAQAGIDTHPFVVKFYPLTDGEVHAFIEDVIDQQKYVNRLITLIDHIMQASAKGVLLYPETAIPDGFTWDDVKTIWRQSNGILPYTPNMTGDKPQQIAYNNTNIGAFDMIQLQLKLLEEISGVAGALQGKNINTAGSVNLYRTEVLNASIALTDVFDTFNSWRMQRNKLIENVNNTSK